MRGVLYEEEIAIMNVYCPPGISVTVTVTTAFSKLVELTVRDSFIGDFNCHLSPIMDISPPGKLAHSPEAKIVTALC